MRIHCDVTDYFHVFHAVNGFRLPRLDRRTSQEFLAGRNVDERGRVVIWMNALFHGRKENRLLALARFEARVRFADHVKTTLATNHLAVRVTRLCGLER